MTNLESVIDRLRPSVVDLDLKGGVESGRYISWQLVVDALRNASEPSLAQPHADTFVSSITTTDTGIPFTHWSKDFLVPYIGCNCSTCVDARASENRGEKP